jgi:hypothetical protein
MFSSKLCPSPGQRQKSEGGIYRLTNFQKVCELRGYATTDLDDYMVAFAKWVLSVHALHDTEAEKIATKAQRQLPCQRAGVPMYEWAPQTLTSYVNALAVLYKSTKTKNPIVPKAKCHFPKFVTFVNTTSRLKILEFDSVRSMHFDSGRSMPPPRNSWCCPRCDGRDQGSRFFCFKTKQKKLS